MPSIEAAAGEVEQSLKSGNGVTVVIVNFNADVRLAECARSALMQCDELIVVDNASTDDSLREVERVAAQDSKVTLMVNAKNLGFARACNIGATAASNDLLLFINPDCVLDPGAIEAMRRALHNQAGVGMVGGLLLNADGSEQAGGRRLVPTPWRSFVRAFGLLRFKDRYPGLLEGYDLHLDPLPAEPEEVEAISGACMLVRKQALDEVGMLDDGYFMHCEDLDWCMRFRQHGWKILFVPDARVVHYKGACSASRPVFVEWHKHKGMVRFYRKFFRHQYPGVLMWLVMLGVWSRFAAVACSHVARRIWPRAAEGGA